MIYRNADTNDISTLTSLINRSYRGESSRAGWTTEADLLSGKRIDETALLQLLNNTDSLVLVAQSNESIIGAIHAHHQNNTVHFGLFAIEPTLQGSGIGKALLSYAELEITLKWAVTTAIMEVISHRTELIEYYERRGYKSTGEMIAFPESNLWAKKVNSLELAVLRKKLSPM